ncbi:hypothetical protein N7481_003650 [Penicillium waksmanii]|uniref:uncharacterized protein n=1 Tax=Penicillium waksmanii TaxID=69791 RepID=UPI002547653F|nr:uncharacterized protein N7481_003650 [Penicillium waksmanii]KAJ5988440.1 hypothetical protein N7481_003650 [Penicillium waksmanii]
MPQSIVGVGHSMGAGQLVLLSMLHPRLFTSLTLIEPVISPDIFTGQEAHLDHNVAQAKGYLEIQIRIIQAARKSYKRWDKRVLDRWISNGYRELPVTTRRDSDDSHQADQPVTLASPNYQEVLQYLRSNPLDYKPVGTYEVDETSSGHHDHLLYSDIIGPPHANSPFYQYEPILAWKMLKHIRPAVFNLHGESSPIATPEMRANMLNRTGTGVGGNGGVRESRVQQMVLKGSHQLPLEQVAETTSAIGPWVGQSAQSWKEDEVRLVEGWAEQSMRDRLKAMNDWVPVLQGLYKTESQKRDSRP